MNRINVSFEKWQVYSYRLSEFLTVLAEGKASTMADEASKYSIADSLRAIEVVLKREAEY
jgi:hypothetical protein